MEAFAPFLFIGIVALVIVAAVLGAMAEKKRREAIMAVAARLGLSFTAKDTGIPREYHFLDRLRSGEGGRYAYNVLRGMYRDHPVQAFDYHFITRSRDSKGRTTTHHHHFSCYLLEQEHSFPELRIYPENLLSRLGQALGFDDIDFESIEFSKAFAVRSKDKKFAYDICHTRMMEYLLAHRQLAIEIENRVICICFGNTMRPEEIEERLGLLVEIRALFPEYLYQN